MDSSIFQTLMSTDLFSELVKDHFAFLLDDYGFSVSKDIYSPKYMGNAQVVIVSATVGVSIVFDRSQVLINLGPLSLPEQEWFEFTDVMEYFGAGQEAAYSLPTERLDRREIMEVQLSRRAQLISRYGLPLFDSGFSQWEEIKAIQNRRTKQMAERLSRSSPHS